ncbi:hypothetical protein [Cohnella abietis]|uniref:Lipoprotein n=1 Tax=Cohnella abietis TaxID=2507935 RepID=A0A3T1D5T0_9BACL|nr:hypothetical protein [Cohnella abietis]BBI33472.1 hypothetical protein KCTCHS21_28710 [Cohnella abietis]
MQIKQIIVLIFLFFVVACSSKNTPDNQPLTPTGVNNTINSEQTAISDVIKSMFVEDSYPAEIMTIGLPGNINERANQITLKMQDSIKNNEEWYLTTLQSLKKGAEFSYDSRLGITEEEYSFILNLNDHMKLIKIGETTIDIQSENKNLNFMISNSSVLKNFAINLAKNSINADLGEFSYSGKIVASDHQKITGRWNGYSWRLEEGYSKAFQISLGQFKNNNKRIIYIKLLEFGKESKEEFLIF